jgi:hypothetical protein
VLCHHAERHKRTAFRFAADVVVAEHIAFAVLIHA